MKQKTKKPAAAERITIDPTIKRVMSATDFAGI